MLQQGAALIDQARDQYWPALAARTYDASGALADGNATREELARL